MLFTYEKSANFKFNVVLTGNVVLTASSEEIVIGAFHVHSSFKVTTLKENCFCFWHFFNILYSTIIRGCLVFF